MASWGAPGFLYGIIFSQRARGPFNSMSRLCFFNLATRFVSSFSARDDPPCRAHTSCTPFLLHFLHADRGYSWPMRVCTICRPLHSTGAYGARQVEVSRKAGRQPVDSHPARPLFPLASHSLLNGDPCTSGSFVHTLPRIGLVQPTRSSSSTLDLTNSGESNKRTPATRPV